MASTTTATPGDAGRPAGEGAPVAAREGAPPQGRRERRGLVWRARNAGAAAVGAVGSGFLALARLVMTVAALIALLIALAIVLRDVDANAGNSIVKGIHDGANFFAGAFTDLIKFSGNHPKKAITINWGIALLVFLVAGALIARFIRRIGLGGVRMHRTHRTALR